MRPLGWVPGDAWLTPGYAEWRPPAALRGLVSCLWASVTPAGPAGDRLVLPDGCSDLVWEQGAGGFLAGPDTGPQHAAIQPGSVLVGLRFRPAAGGQVLGLPLSEVRDQRVPLDDVLPGVARRARGGLLPADVAPQGAAGQLLDLAGRLAADRDADPAVTRATAWLRDPAARAEEIAGQTGLSERQLRRRFHAAAGYGPKTLQRVLRFQRFVRLSDAADGPLDLADAAARAGYADQPHLTRECRALSGHTPAELRLLRRPAA